MKRLLWIILAAALILNTAASASGAEVTAPPRQIVIPDQNVYHGSWPDTYLSILYRHADRIRENQDLVTGYDGDADHARLFVCLYDVGGDGIPELFFTERGPSGADGAVGSGRLYVYSNDGSASVCVIFIDDFEPEAVSGPGHRVFMTAEGLALQYGCGAEQSSRLFRAADLSEIWNIFLMGAGGDDPDGIRCYLNGQVISPEEFRDHWDGMYGRRTVTLADSDGPGPVPGCLYTLDEAIAYLASFMAGPGSSPAPATPVPVVTPAPVPTVYDTPAPELYGVARGDISTRGGPSSSYPDMGTYNVKGMSIRVFSRAQDANGLWWVKCGIPYGNEIRVLWTVYERFDSGTLPLESIPVGE